MGVVGKAMNMSVRAGTEAAGTMLLGPAPKLPDAPKPPPGAPDATDELVQKARASELEAAKLKKGRASTFLTGPSGVTAPLSVAMSRLGGK